jgi:hypothetical protein
MWHVFCAEENDCTMMPDLYATSKSEAVRRWNSRADLPRATVVGESLLIALKAAANYVCRAQSDHYDAETRDTVIKALTHEINQLESTPRVTGETTVEAALAELREMFPDATFLSVKKHAIYQPSMGDLPNQADVQIEDKGFRRETLADCMAQVRAATRTEGSHEPIDSSQATHEF